jgi:bacterial leucyl aminopeptidase
MSFTRVIGTVLAVLLGSSSTYAQTSTLWIATGNDVAGIAQRTFTGRALLADGRPVFRTFESNNNVSVAEIAEGALDEFAGLIHAGSPRCGGFTVHASREAALNEVNNRAYIAGFRAPARLPDTIDQQGIVKHALDRVSGSKILRTNTTLQSIGTRYYQTQKGQEAAELIRREWETLGSGRADFNVGLFPHAWIQNSVIGTIRGASSPDEIVIIGAHLDSINPQNNQNAPGADDDASGIAVVTEMLRVMMEIGFKPRRTIQFMAYSAEEVGLRGSGEIADKYKSEGKNVVAVLQMDMTGFKGSERDVYLVNDFVSPELNAFLVKLLQEYNHSGAHQITHAETTCGYACSDHQSWTRNGVHAAFPFEAAFSDYNRAIHSTQDTVAVLDPTGANHARFAKLGIEFLIETAKSADGVSAQAREK